ncbi:hypothetical protein J2Y38_001707 [Flavobacterium sp. 2755]|uniref:hypothetical protein n=1 Tax=Flavobacterium sp. 2755 TaxID=2817765 RepID=UPI00285AC8B8|nr:hypothetical protein [Flavobacterium sp. 2755]MDR6761498.1 hypothetical protein [Flavobacterium sp. 2755]
MKKLILIFALITVLSSCKKADAEAVEVCDGCLTFYFENPQPINDSELRGFPSKFKGLYMNNDSTYIRIEEDRILREYFYKYRFHKYFLDSLKQKYEVVNDQLIDKETKEKIDFYFKGDSIEMVEKSIDTIFRFSLNQKAKRIDGQLVLSTRDSIFWDIKTIALEKNILKIKHIYLREDLSKLDSVTLIKGKMLDSTSYLIKPTRREFKNILKIKKIGTDQEYDKVLDN